MAGLNWTFFDGHRIWRRTMSDRKAHRLARRNDWYVATTVSVASEVGNHPTWEVRVPGTNGLWSLVAPSMAAWAQDHGMTVQPSRVPRHTA